VGLFEPDEENDWSSVVDMDPNFTGGNQNEGVKADVLQDRDDSRMLSADSLRCIGLNIMRINNARNVDQL